MPAPSNTLVPIGLLGPFEPPHALFITRWVANAAQLHWLAPSTVLPLTPAKVLAWKKPGGHAYIFTNPAASAPLAYGELNPMRDHPDHLWLGHLIVDPAQRRRGIARAFLKALVDLAFRQHLAATVSLIVFPDNAPAIACYRGAGFKEVGEEFHQFGEIGPYHRLLRFELHAPPPH